MPSRPDWVAIREAREIDGRRWSELARQFGVTRQRIQRRAVREGWRNPGELVRKATEDFARRFVARESEAVIDAFRETLDASRRILALATTRIEALEENPAEANPGVLKDLAEVIRKSRVVQSDIGGLNRGDGWRPTSSEDDAMAKASEDRIRKALERLCAPNR